MSHPDIVKRPERESADGIYTIGRALLAAVPYVGGSAAELLALVVSPPLEKRRDEWIQSIAVELKQLEEETACFKLENLAQDEQFVTTVLYATRSAIATHQQEKIGALRNAVLNAALPRPLQDDVQMMFLQWIDTLTTWHLRILKFLDNPAQWAARSSTTYPNWDRASLTEVLDLAFPQIQGNMPLYGLLVGDLYAHGLVSIANPFGWVEEQGTFPGVTTELGRQFLTFIESPLNRSSDDVASCH